MSDAVDKMTDEEIAKWQEELYTHEEQAGGVFTGPVMTEEEKMERIKAFLADNYLEKLHAKVNTVQLRGNSRKYGFVVTRNFASRQVLLSGRFLLSEPY